MLQPSQRITERNMLKVNYQCFHVSLGLGLLLMAWVDRSALTSCRPQIPGHDIECIAQELLASNSE